MPKTPNATDALIARAVLRDIRSTPQKSRRVVNLIRGERADVALTTLKFAPQDIGEDLFTLLNSAINNAKQKNPSLRDASELWVVEALVDEGATLKRFRPRAQGRGFQILKRTSQITLTLSDDRGYRGYGQRKVVNKKATVTPIQKPATPAATTEAAPVKKAAAKKAPVKKAAAKKAPAKKATEKAAE